jgi:hypothetical protein
MDNILVTFTPGDTPSPTEEFDVRRHSRTTAPNGRTLSNPRP